MSYNYDFMGDNRKDAERYLELQDQMAALKAELEHCRGKVVSSFEACGQDYKTSEKTVYKIATIRRKGKPVYLMYKHTTKKGQIDYEAMMADLGISKETAEKYRKPDNTAITITEATPKQIAEFNLLNLE